MNFYKLLELDYLCATAPHSVLRAHCERTGQYLRTGLSVKRSDVSVWWSGKDALARARRSTSEENLGETPVLVAHDINRTTQIKMYGLVPWDYLLKCAMRSFDERSRSCRRGFGEVPRAANGDAVSLDRAPSVCFHVLREEQAPVVHLLLDFDFEEKHTWEDARSTQGPVARVVRAIESAWRTWFPGCEAHVLLFETRSDATDASGEKPSVHGYVFETLAGVQTRSAYWPFTGPVFACKRAHRDLFACYLHPLLRSDPYFEQRGLHPEKFLDCMDGHTARAVGMAKTGRDNFLRYSRLETAMSLSSPLALDVYRRNPIFTIGRMLGLFVDTPVSTFARGSIDGVLRHTTRIYEVVMLATKIFTTEPKDNRNMLGEGYRAQRVSNESHRVARVESVSLELQSILTRAYRACLRVIGVRREVVDHMQLDIRRIRAQLDRTGAELSSLLVYQRPECTFCPLRDCRVKFADSSSRVPARVVYDDDTASDAGHTRGDAAKMYVVYHLHPRYRLIRHHCWKCKGARATDNGGVVIGVLSRRMVQDIKTAAASCVSVVSDAQS
ncbi:hypothetical protein CYMTET_54417 [Cymbomonas tetramitiformis]|uniref:Uncharacterized protein n=1 Tax=Cymbomonas tetramitiformis TaxID=36881 RepID=A0AAE0EP23_9CHLO|nr:hypothetical protein CYMTET_54417 [Cymbomonas tetramitiformis]